MRPASRSSPVTHRREQVPLPSNWARNFFLSPERTLMRKIKEAFLAIRIEQMLNKNEILELYLNKIYLGYRAYGVGAAAQVYFGKTVDQLSLSEMAVIAGAT
ncbi:penicillin-binding protein 1A [Salmonella enterica subsp. enterica serovar Poona]|nr:penicillin-binding protein 1A [Salmonella enterica subsp. enterica serovar Poona]